ncbi:DNA-binding transcriptional LysR family regulator [Povalibacter uvarum]|uniref:DNA-binding transcriptional LysR family regulator n=1 Tax=Povalibacter uvarum TaxID=732238 RepID=A0A841HN14_9GAMM|nr:LysR substrate-binding domain-containing protein [Povalibacter uvarum]MBB6093739.1 DNA-binding transcriptional LysR family regulator [Povalibacter uvarum]
MLAEETLRARLPSSHLPSRKALPPFEALRAFDAIARLGGVRKAAQYLCRDHAVVSRHLRAIEEWTGAKLIERTPGGAVLTEEGVRYHREVAVAMDLIANATIDLMKRGDNRCLHIRCMPGFALHWLSARLGDFERANPGIDVELRPADRSPELLTQDTDIEIRLVPSYVPTPFQLPSNLKAAEVATVAIIAAASKGYMNSAPPVREPRDLLKLQLLHEENFDRWRNWLGAHGVVDDVDLTGPRLWQGHLTLDAARHGRGAALTNQLIVADDIAAGRLVEVGQDLPTFQPKAMGSYYFIAKADRWDSTLIRRFRQWLVSTIATQHPELRSGNAE